MGFRGAIVELLLEEELFRAAALLLLLELVAVDFDLFGVDEDLFGGVLAPSGGSC